MAKQVIALTGASGFVGGALSKALSEHCYQVIEIGRRPSKNSQHFYEAELSSTTDFSACLKGVDVCIHVAARAHVMNESAENPAEVYNEANTKTTLNLAYQAAKEGVKRFIFISSIKVNGESTSDGHPFNINDTANPSDPYGFSKAEAELALKDIMIHTAMEVVIIRPPLVYGPGVKANFLSMLKLAQKNLPLPLGSIKNKRSLVALDNLVDLIVTCINHPSAANQTFLVSDDHDVSTSELLQMMTRAAGKTPRLLPVPVSWLKLAAKLTGKQAVIERLCGNLQVDISHTKHMLDWKPPVEMEEGIRRCFVKEDLC
ncbi:MAG: SDR family oxidoreductase [Paraglaciecola sp.]|nr:SDR family oxidoreductase [Paraglaciecola sp.]